MVPINPIDPFRGIAGPRCGIMLKGVKRNEIQRGQAENEKGSMGSLESSEYIAKSHAKAELNDCNF